MYWSVLRAGSWRFSLSLQNQVLGVSYIFETMLRKVLRCGANSSDEFVLAVKFQLAYSIIRFAPTSHSFIARFGQFEILVRIALWIHFPCHIVDHICETKGFPPQIFDFWKTKGFERANICPICSNISNTNSDTCFQTKFQSNFIWNYSPFIGLLSPDHPSLSLLLSLSLYHLAKLTFTFLLFKTLCSVALAYLQSFFQQNREWCSASKCNAFCLFLPTIVPLERLPAVSKSAGLQHGVGPELLPGRQIHLIHSSLTASSE